MAKNLVIVESPAKANTIKKYLGKTFNVVASNGHVRDLPKSQLGVDLDNDFEPKYITIRGKGDVLKKIRQEVKKSDNIYLATDPDREGEAISWHLKFMIDADDKNVSRITFNEITKNAVKNAIKEPRKIDIDLVDSQQARRILDRIVGYKISPLLWAKVRKGLSAGRVQSVATRLVCDKEREIDAFVPKEYWTFIATLKKDKSEFQAKLTQKDGKKIEVDNEKDSNTILKDIENGKYIVQDIKKQLKRRSPNPPFTTSTLQQEASTKLRFTTKKTMMIAQKLYEGMNIKGFGTTGLITYMRTDSVRVSNEALNNVRDYIKNDFGDEYTPSKPRFFKDKKNAQDAHEAIRPSNVLILPSLVKDQLKKDEYRLYKLIWDRFVSSQMKEAIFDNVSVDIDCNGYTFKATGSQIKFDGFLKVYNDKASENSQVLPNLEKDEELEFIDLENKQNFTQPPNRYTEASLVRTMEELGIGRPSTYAPTISTIISRGYVQRDKRTLFPTELGFIVNDLMIEHFKDIMDVKFTANMEDSLDSVEDGKVEWRKLISDFYGKFKEDLDKAEKNIGKIEIKDEETDIPCDKCGRMMVIKSGRFGKFLACPGFPECRNTKQIVVEHDKDCPLCGGKIHIKKTRRQKKYYQCEKYPDCELRMWDEPTGEKCPKCNSALGKNRFKKIVCTSNDCDFERGV